MARIAPLFALLAGVLAAPSLAVAETFDMDGLVRAMEGDFAPDAAIDPPFFDLYTRVRKVDLPAFGDPAFYVEMRRESFTGPVSRQRIYAMTGEDAQGPVMTAWDFPDGTPYHGAWAEPSKLAGLTPKALSRFHEGCLIRWQETEAGFIGTVTRESCILTNAESGREVAVDMVMSFDEAAFGLQEQGFAAGTDQALFGRAEPFVFPRRD